MDVPREIDETGTLIRQGGAFFLRRDAGGLVELELQRTPVDLVEKRVRIVGVAMADGRLSVDGVAAIVTSNTQNGE